jgi:hypothetical protein
LKFKFVSLKSVFFFNVKDICSYSPFNHSVHTMHPKYSWKLHIILTCHCELIGKTVTDILILYLFWFTLLFFFPSFFSFFYYSSIYFAVCFVCFSCLFLLHLTYSQLWDSFVSVTWTWVEITLWYSFSYIWNFITRLYIYSCLFCRVLCFGFQLFLLTSYCSLGLTGMGYIMFKSWYFCHMF